MNQPKQDVQLREADGGRADAGHSESQRRGFRFDDPYWDEAFDTYYDPAMRVCSVFGC